MRNAHRLFFAVWLAGFILAWLRLLGVPLAGFGPWAEGVLLLLAAATTLLGLARSLPAQNVLFVAVLIAVIAGVTTAVGAKTAIPFGPFVYTEAMGLRAFDSLPWTVPVLWLVIVLNSRGVARMILRPWRKTRNYGFWVIGLTCLLTVLLDFGLEPFAAVVRRYWLWRPTRLLYDWYGAPWVNFVAWALTTLLVLVIATPWLINKRPLPAGRRPLRAGGSAAEAGPEAHRHSTPQFYSLTLWLLLNLYFATGNALHQLWPAVGVTIVACAVATLYAVRGARW